MATVAKRPGQRTRWRLLLVGVVTATAIAVLVAGRGDLLFGVLMWSLVAVPGALLVLFLGRHADDVGSYLGGRDPYEGHGPPQRDRRRR